VVLGGAEFQFRPRRLALADLQVGARFIGNMRRRPRGRLAKARTGLREPPFPNNCIA
jgi:hypothetical protein